MKAVQLDREALGGMAMQFEERLDSTTLADLAGKSRRKRSEGRRATPKLASAS